MELSEDTKLEIHNIECTLGQLKKAYESGTDINDNYIKKWLKFGKDYILGALEAGASAVIVFEDQLQLVELAVHAYEYCLPEDHPIKSEYSIEQVRRYLQLARVSCDGSEYR